MKKKVKPTLYIGLGAAGASLIEKCAAVQNARSPELCKVAADLCIEANGQLQSYFREARYFKFSFKTDAVDQSIYKANYQTFIQKEEEINTLIRKHLTEINNIDNRRVLISAGYEIGDPQVMFVSPLGDAIGSPLVLGFAKLVNRIFKEGNYAYSQATALYLLPDLFYQSEYLSQTLNIMNDYQKDEIVQPALHHSDQVAQKEINYTTLEEAGQKTVLFSKGEGHPKAIDFNDVSGIGADKKLHALLAAIARTQPEHLKNMISDNQDGTYAIRFYTKDQSEKFVTVDEKFWLTNELQSVYSGITKIADEPIEIWPLLIEKAWAKLNKGYENVQVTNFSTIDSAWALTGEKFKRLKIDEYLNEESFVKDIHKHFNEQSLPVMFTSKAGSSAFEDEDLEYNHIYVLKEVSERNKSFNLYNPAGNKHLYNIDIAFIKQHFRSITMYFVKPFEAISTQRTKDIKNKNYARAYATLNELDFTLDKNEERGTRIIRHNFIVGSKNNLNVSLGTFNEMLVSLTEFSLMLMNEQFATQHLNVHLEDETGNKTNRYSSIGYSTLIFPEEKMMDGLINIGKNEVLNEIQTNFRNTKFDINEISGEAKHYYYDKNLGELIERLALEEDKGQPIFKPFNYTGDRNETVDLNLFYNGVEAASGQYEKEQFGTHIIKKLTSRKEVLATQYVNEVNTQSESYINDANKGINYAHAFTSVLLREDCSSLSGQLLEGEEDLRTVENQVLAFYKSKTELPEQLEKADQLAIDLKNKEKRMAYLTEEVEDLREKMLVEMGDIGGGEKTTTIDLSNLETELKSKNEELVRLQEEVSKDKEGYQDLQKTLEDTKRKLESAAFRKEIKDADLKEQQAQQQEIRTQLQSNDSTRTLVLDKIEKLKEKRDKLLKRLLIFYPLVVFGIPAALVVFLHAQYPVSLTKLFQSSETNAFEVWGSLFLLLLIGYAIWAFLKYRKQIAKPMKKLNLQMKDHNNEKIGLVNNYLKLENEQFQLRFQHLKFAHAYETILKVIQAVKKTKRSLGGFKSAIIQTYENTAHKIDGLHFENNLFESNIIERKDMEQYKESATASDFFIDKENRKIVNYYNAYKETGDITKLESEVTDFFKTQYRHLSNKNLYDFLFRDNYIQNKTNTSTRMKLMGEASQVYLNLKDFGTGDPTEEKCDLYYNGVGEKDALQLTNVLLEQGFKAESKEENNNKNKLSIFRAKRGFPAFKITLVDECRTRLQQFSNTGDSVANFYVYEDAIENDLYPNNILLGNKNDIVRVNYLKGVVLGIITSKNKEVYLMDQKIGDHQKAAIDYLKSLKGENDKDRLIDEVQKQLDNIHQNNKQNGLSNAIQQLVKSNVKLDQIDQEILDDWIRTIL